MRTTERDCCTQSNVDELTTNHLELDLKADFVSKTFSGSVVLSMTTKRDNVAKIVLDTRDVDVTMVSAKKKGQKDKEYVSIPDFSIGAKDEAFGSALTIPLPEALSANSAGDGLEVRVAYQTSPECTALGWLAPEQTDGGKHPYVFSQCQAIHARSIVPCQDSPGVRATYGAALTVPNELTALMSALVKETTVLDDWKTCTFEQPTAIPSYLIALAIGQLESKDISDRVRVWSEPANLEAVAYEFAETDQFVAAGEALLGPYVWKRYDILSLPGSFPYGGMENPCLTFVTPTLLAGDRSLADVIAHEVSHSWTGNLVTNGTWEDFWLNEGFTMYVQRSIVSAVAKDERLFDFDSIIGYQTLVKEVNGLGAENAYTCLRPNLQGVDPDDAFSSIPYEKGYSLLYHIQTLVGGADVFRPWLANYIQTFQNQCITTKDFMDHLKAYFSEKGLGEKIDSVDWDAWFDKPGLPPAKLEYSQELANESVELAKKWKAGGEGAQADDIKGWVSLRIVCFLNELLEDREGLPTEVAQRLGATYSFDKTKNTEIEFRWYMISLQSKNFDVLDGVKDMLTRQGRMKFTRPLYRKLNECKPELAKEWFLERQKRYHSICAKMVAKDLGV